MIKETCQWRPTVFTSKGFTLVEILVTVTIIGILAAIAVPQYLNYISGARQKAADNNLEQFSVLLESYRAENGSFPADATYTYTEDGSGAITTNSIGGSGCTVAPCPLPDFLPRSSSAKQTPFHYTIVVTGSGTTTEQAVVNVTGVGNHSGYDSTFPFK